MNCPRESDETTQVVAVAVVNPGRLWSPDLWPHQKPYSTTLEKEADFPNETAGNGEGLYVQLNAIDPAFRPNPTRRVFYIGVSSLITAVTAAARSLRQGWASMAGAASCHLDEHTRPRQAHYPG